MQEKTFNPETTPSSHQHQHQHHVCVSMPEASTSKSQDIQPVEKRVYQVWKGNNKFLFGGRLVLGPDLRSIMLTLFLIVTPVLSFCMFGTQPMIDKFPHNLGMLTVAFPACFTSYIVILLFITSARDPGIVPRSLVPPELEDDGDMTGMPIDWPVNRGGSSAFRPTKDVIIDGMVVKVKYCHTCMLYRPPRSSHCSVCNNCVERFDHHCPWVGQCIGKRNYIFFFMFVSSTALLCLFVFTFSWVNVSVIMQTSHCSLGRAFLKSPVSGILIIYTFISAWFVGGLTAFHVYLISINQTTYENFRYRYDGKMNSYNRGLLHNFKEVFCSRIPKSKINFRAMVKETPVKQIMGSAPSSSMDIGRAPSSSMGMAGMGRMMSPKVLHQKSFDVEMDKKQKSVVEEEIRDVQRHMEAVRLERCGTGTSTSSWDHKGKSSMEAIPYDVRSMDSEFGKEHHVTDREKD